MSKDIEFVVPLKPSEADKELYRRNDQNIAQVCVQLPDGELKTNCSHTVEIRLTKDAMLGLGSALIRAAHQKEMQGSWELDHAKLNHAVEILGIYLHPSSCRVVINLVDLPKLSEILTE